MNKLSSSRWVKHLNQTIPKGKDALQETGSKMFSDFGYPSIDESVAMHGLALLKDNPKVTSTQYADSIKKVIRDRQEHLKPDATASTNVDYRKTMMEFRPPKAKPPAWAKTMKRDPEEVIDIVHGGAKGFLKDITSGTRKSEVYLEDKTRGLWVHPS